MNCVRHSLTARLLTTKGSTTKISKNYSVCCNHLITEIRTAGAIAISVTELRSELHIVVALLAHGSADAHAVVGGSQKSQAYSRNPLPLLAGEKVPYTLGF